MGEGGLQHITPFTGAELPYLPASSSIWGAGKSGGGGGRKMLIYPCSACILQKQYHFLAGMTHLSKLCPNSPSIVKGETVGGFGIQNSLSIVDVRRGG